jgi:hypothetical protein
MANVRKGLKRVVWILSIIASLAAWVILFTAADLKPEKNINKEGISFIKWLDSHYFNDPARSEIEQKASELAEKILINRQNSKSQLMAAIANGVKTDSLERWPFVWEYIPEGTKILDPDLWEIHSAWQERLRKSLQLYEKEIRNTFPDIKYDKFMDRYSDAPSLALFGSIVLPESYFNIEYKQPYGRMAILLLLGFVPFVAIWFIWLLITWVLQGFRS